MASNMEAIGNAIREAASYPEQNPNEGRSTDSLARAGMVEGLRCRAGSPDGDEIFTDMVTEIGGGGTAPSPGWLMRAALAACDATLITMRAAGLGVELTALEVDVDSESDDRGLLGVDDSAPGGPLRVRTRIRIGSNSADAETLREIVEWCDRRSPVADAISRSVPSEVETEIV